MDQLRRTGINVLGDVPWGTHFCQFCQTKDDLVDILVPYFRAGLSDNEFCMWVTSDPLGPEQAKEALRKATPDIDRYLENGQLEIIPYTDWYVRDGVFDSQRVLDGWVERLNSALAKGYAGLRLTGNTLWLEKANWQDFTDYEAAINDVIGKYRMIALCTYLLGRCTASEIMDVIKNHQFALIKRQGEWELVEALERGQLRQALRETEEKYRIVADNTYDWVFWVSPEGRFLYSSPACEQITGYAPGEFEKDSELMGRIIHPADRAAYLGHRRAELGIQGTIELEFRITRRDGTERWVGHLCQPVINAEGRYLGTRGTNRDITERKQAEAEIRKLNQDLAHRAAELDAINKELETFSYSVSHDLRAPLRSMDGFSQALLEDYAERLDAEGRSHLQRIRTASQRMAQLIDDMLSLSRVTRSEMHLDTFDMSALAQQVVTEIGSSQPERQVEFCIEPGLVVNADRRLIRIALENLLGNAWKFTSKHPRARIELGMVDQNGERAYYVRDDGAGFDAAYAGKLFGAFQRLHGATEFPGTGIGLATVQRIIHRHGGRVWAEGAVERGATFYFTL